jgi:patatin-related protein
MAQQLDDTDGRGPAVLTDFDKQDIRVAVVMNGGVSLAIWISGVTLELRHLALRADAPVDPWPEYREVLELLHATARIDVIAGTSAGGLNGAFLALGLARGRDLATMRDLWKKHGALDRLLRDPLVKDPPSLLQGDAYFLVKVRAALQEVLRGPAADTSPADQKSRHAFEEPLPIELFLTGTLWDGRTSVFTDDMDTPITEVDYDATFRFSDRLPARRDGRARSGDLRDDGVVPELAAAARSTSSFPAAFEPHWVAVDGDDGVPDGRFASDAGRLNFTASQYVVDGGVLLNKPLRPALEAIHRQPAGLQVRRVLAYVVPAPGERTTQSVMQDAPVVPAAQAAPQDRPAVPTAQTVLLSVLTRMRSTDSVSRELTELRTRNDAADSRRGARVQLATAMTEVAAPLSDAAWEGYRQVRVGHAARTIARLLAAGQVNTSGRWSERELVEALRAQPMRFVPRGTLEQAVKRTDSDWDWGQTTVFRLAEMTLDVLRRAVWLAPIGSEARAQIVECRWAVHMTLKEIRDDQTALNDYWTAAPRGNPDYETQPIPDRAGPANGPATNRPALDNWLAGILHKWDEVVPAAQAGVPDRRTLLYRHALNLAGHLRQCAPSIKLVCDHPNDALGPDEPKRLLALYSYLLEPASDREVLERLLRLDVVQLAYAGATEEVQQQVDLVQVSARQPGQLTGVQEHHFGAFYRPSWRVNDWLHGRMDGAEQLVRLLLLPERLRQLGPAAPTIQHIHSVAVGPPGHQDHDWLETQWDRYGQECANELEAARTSERLPLALPLCARQIARRIQTRILREDLPALAEAIREEPDPQEGSIAWLENYKAADPLETAALWRLWNGTELVGGQLIRDEVGTDTFARTAAKTTAVAANTLGTMRRPKVVGTVLRAFRGYALTVWAMIHFLTMDSRFGTHAVEIALAAGGVLLALTILVPGIPLGLTLLGAVLLLAGLTTAALLTPGAKGVGRRLLVATVVVAAALAGFLWWDWRRNHANAVGWTLLIKVGVALLIIFLGWWVAWSQRPEGRPDRRRRGKAGAGA